MNKVNKIYRSDIIMLYPYLQNYLETGIINDKIKDFLENLYKDCYSIQTMLCSGLKNGHLFNYSNSSIDFRFYINMPINKETILFCRDYQILCQKFDIPYTMKEFKECGEKAKDVTVFYSSLEDLPLKITILKYLIKIYPNMELGSPLIACSSLPDLPYLGFSNNGIQVKKGDGSIKNGVTYADMIQYLFNSILNFFVSNYVLNTEKFSEKTKNKIENLKRNGIIQNSRHVVFNDVLVYNYYTFDGEEREIVKNYIKQCMDNSLKKQVMIQFFMHNIRVAYNANNGFPEDYIPNVAFDTWYINEKLDSITKNETKTSSHPRK